MNKKSILKKLVLFTQITLYFLITSCSTSEINNVVIWTNCREFAQYQELFNSTHPDNKIIITYKENPASSLPPLKDELSPDIIIGNWLNSDEIIDNFISLDYLFDRKILSSSSFYPQLLQYGKYKNEQYLLPISFNLPCVIFSNKNDKLIEDDFILSLDQIQEISKKFNVKKSNGKYTKMGFCVSCNEDFLYLVTKLFGVNFNFEKNQIHFNQKKLDQAIEYLKNWISTANTSIQSESDFNFKYLQSPIQRQVTSDDKDEKTLFCYSTSNHIFKILHEQNFEIDYRWISQDGFIPIEDSVLMLGIYKKTDKLAKASEFLSWFFRTDTQEKILQRKENFKLRTDYFGIADGFSSLQEVTEKILPTYYVQTITNLPPSQLLKCGLKYSSRWESYLSKIIIPYLLTKLNNDEKTELIGFSEFEKEWEKKIFD